MSELDDADFFSAIDSITGANGAELLNEVRAAFNRYVVLPSDHAYIAVVLWTVATHALSAFEHATRLAIHSPVKRCGKTRLLEILTALVYEPLASTNISTPSLYRVIEKAGDRPPTVLLDEADRLFGSQKKDEDNRDLIALFNNGFRQGSPTWRCVGPQQEPTAFSNYAMAAIAGIGRKPDTIEDRAVNITIRRKLPSETVAKFRLRTDKPALHELRDRIGVWVEINLPVLEKLPAGIPTELEDRAQDTWEPLFAVADAAGGDWPGLARKAAVELSRQASDDDDELSIRLLRDVVAIFEALSHVGFVATKVLLQRLRALDDAPWMDLDLTSRKLALWLKDYEIRPRQNAARTERGYHREDLFDAAHRYTRPDPSGPVQAPENKAWSPDTSRTGHDEPSNPSATRPGIPPEIIGLDGSGQVRTDMSREDGGTDGACRTCGRSQPRWVTESRDGQCVDCHRRAALKEGTQ
jgi:hypothetical protein